MALTMARPIRDPKSGIWRLKVRVPADLRVRAHGETVILPIGDDLRSVRIGEFVEASLRAREPLEAKQRYAKALSALLQHWNTLRDGPEALTHMKAVALAGEVYRRVVEDQRADQTNSLLRNVANFKADLQEARAGGNGELRRFVSQFLGPPEGALGFVPFLLTQAEFTALALEGVEWRDGLEAAFGPVTDHVLAREGRMVSAEGRSLLLECVYGAVRDALMSNARNVEGDYSPDPQAARFPSMLAVRQAERPVATITGLLEAYLRELQASGRGSGAAKRWTPVFVGFAAFLEHNDAARVTAADVARWKELRLENGIAARTIAHTDLASLKAVFNWAVDNGKLEANPAARVRIKVGRKVRNREQGYTSEEALVILKAAREYRGGSREYSATTAAKRWTPWLAAFTGARIGELCQLRKQDVREDGDIAFIRITPEAGTVKSGEHRDVPLHPQLIEEGFLSFVEGAPQGVSMRRGPQVFSFRSQAGLR